MEILPFRPFSKLLSWPKHSGIRLLSGFMRVGILPAAPLPGGVKVARRLVKPFGVGANPTLAAIFQGVMSAADGLPRKEEDGSASLPTLTISDDWQSSNAPVPKTERASGLRGCNSYTIRHFSKPSTKGNPMKPVLRYQSQLLFRRSSKPNRVIRIRPVELRFSFRPVRFGLKPQIKTYECKST